MSGLGRRLRGLVRQSRIRLERVALEPARVRVGDLLEVEARLWQVAATRVDAQLGACGFDLTGPDGAPGKAFLIGPTVSDADEGPRWTLVYGAARLRLPLAAVAAWPGQSELRPPVTSSASPRRGEDDAVG